MGVYCWNYYWLTTVYIWGEGKKFYVLMKCVEKKPHFCSVWGFSNDLSNQGGEMGWVLYSDSSVDLLYCKNTLYWCTDDICRMGVHSWRLLLQYWVYIFGGRVKNFMF